MNRFKSARRGFTFIELLVTACILAVLMGITVPAIFQLQEIGHRTTCLNNLRQLGASVHLHHDEFGKMPPYSSILRSGGFANWFFFLQPYIESDQLRREDIHGSLGGAGTPYQVLTCPSDPSSTQEPWFSKTNYLANWYAFTDVPKGCFAPAVSFGSLTNGQSNVVLFGEAYSVCNKIPRMSLESPWYHNFGVTGENLPSDDPKYAPNDYTMFQVRPSFDAPPVGCDPWRTQTPHAYMPVCLADGSTRFVEGSIDPGIWKRALQPRTGNPPPGDW